MGLGAISTQELVSIVCDRHVISIVKYLVGLIFHTYVYNLLLNDALRRSGKPCLANIKIVHFFPGYIYSHHLHQSVLPKGRSFTASSGTKAAVLPKGRSSTAKSGTMVAALLGMNRCGSFPLLSAPHSL